MSVVVAICHDGAVYLGADSATTTSNGKRSYALGRLSKILRPDENLLVGSTGSAFVKQLLLGNPELLKVGDGGLNRRWLATEFLPRFREKCREMDQAPDDRVLETDLFIAQGDTLYTFVSDSIYRVNDCTAMGSGCEYAIGTLTDESLSIEDRILGALRAAAEYDEAVESPFVLINTKDLIYKEVAE